MLLLFFAGLICLSNGLNIAGNWSDCTKPGDMGNMTTVVFPANMAGGYNFTITGVGMTSEAIEDPSFEMHIQDGIIVNDKIKGDGCKPLEFKFPLNDAVLYYVPLPCPVAAGPVNVSFILWFNDKCPDGLITNQLIIYDEAKEKGKEVVCVDISLRVTN
eukprot:280972_1